jgi:hypothetical protein
MRLDQREGWGVEGEKMVEGDVWIVSLCAVMKFIVSILPKYGG